MLLRPACSSSRDLLRYGNSLNLSKELDKYSITLVCCNGTIFCSICPNGSNVSFGISWDYRVSHSRSSFRLARSGVPFVRICVISSLPELNAIESPDSRWWMPVEMRVWSLAKWSCRSSSCCCSRRNPARTTSLAEWYIPLSTFTLISVFSSDVSDTFRVAKVILPL